MVTIAPRPLPNLRLSLPFWRVWKSRFVRFPDGFNAGASGVATSSSILRPASQISALHNLDWQKQISSKKKRSLVPNAGFERLTSPVVCWRKFRKRCLLFLSSRCCSLIVASCMPSRAFTNIPFAVAARISAGRHVVSTRASFESSLRRGAGKRRRLGSGQRSCCGLRQEDSPKRRRPSFARTLRASVSKEATWALAVSRKRHRDSRCVPPRSSSHEVFRSTGDLSKQRRRAGFLNPFSRRGRRHRWAPAGVGQPLSPLWRTFRGVLRSGGCPIIGGD